MIYNITHTHEHTHMHTDREMCYNITHTQWDSYCHKVDVETHRLHNHACLLFLATNTCNMHLATECHVHNNTACTVRVLELEGATRVTLYNIICSTLNDVNLAVYCNPVDNSCV